MEILFVGMLHDPYTAKFHDAGNTAIDGGIMLSSLNLVRSWMATGFGGHSRRSIIGFVRHCSTTDMQNSRLSDDVMAIPWDQLVKRGIDESFGRFLTVLESTGVCHLVLSLMSTCRQSAISYGRGVKSDCNPSESV